MMNKTVFFLNMFSDYQPPEPLNGMLSQAAITAADIDPEKVENLKKIVVPVIEDVIGEKVTFDSSSTDCNIPLSLGVPAVCVGCVVGKGAHTREEFVYIDSLQPGIAVAFDLILHHF